MIFVPTNAPTLGIMSQTGDNQEISGDWRLLSVKDPRGLVIYRQALAGKRGRDNNTGRRAGR